MATPGTPLSFSDVLRLRPVRRLWIAQIVSVFGDFLAVFAIIAVVTFKLHGTATQVAMVLVSFMAPLANRPSEAYSVKTSCSVLKAEVSVFADTAPNLLANRALSTARI